MKALDILIRPIEAILSVAVYVLDRVQRRRALWVVVPVVMLAGCCRGNNLKDIQHPCVVVMKYADWEYSYVALRNTDGTMVEVYGTTARAIAENYNVGDTLK
jgi:hypothetical protein